MDEQYTWIESQAHHARDDSLDLGVIAEEFYSSLGSDVRLYELANVREAEASVEWSRDCCLAWLKEW